MEDGFIAAILPIFILSIVMICFFVASIVECRPKSIDFYKKKAIGDERNRFTDEMEFNDRHQSQRECDNFNIITDELPYNNQIQNKITKIGDEVSTYHFDYRQPDRFTSAEEKAQLNLLLEESQIEKAMRETFGDYFKRELKARCMEDLSNLLDPEAVFEQNNEEFQNLTRLKLDEDKYFVIGDNMSSSSSEKIFPTSERKTEKIFRPANPYQQETDEEIAMRLQQELNTEIEKSDEKFAFELRDTEIARIEGFEFPNFESRDFAKSDANRTNERIVEALFEKELRNLHKRKMKDDEKLSESELEDMNFSDFSYNEIDEELPDTKN